jgi:hypothetical protein
LFFSNVRVVYFEFMFFSLKMVLVLAERRKELFFHQVINTGDKKSTGLRLWRAPPEKEGDVYQVEDT